MRARWFVCVVLVCVTASCTTGSATAPTAKPNETPATSATASPAGVTLADGAGLPDGCSGAIHPTQTVAFAADGRAWTVDPAGRDLACLFAYGDPGPFAWGPQGDRVVLGQFHVQSLTKDGPDLPGIDFQPTVFDWGHPIGLAIVFASASGQPLKRFMDDGRVEPLPRLPKGTYQAIAYHPSGLALGFIVDEGARQGIWISSNEGTDPTRLVFSKPDTVFSSIAFSPDGKRIWWIAQHAGAISEIHAMDLADRTGFSTVLTRGLAATAHGLLLAPSGPLMAATQGADCAQGQAMVIDDRGAAPALPKATGPTTALRWLDASTLLVGVGGCGAPTQLVTVDWTHGGQATVVVSGVEVGAPRTVLHDAPTEVPAPPKDATQAPAGGVG